MYRSMNRQKLYFGINICTHLPDRVKIVPNISLKTRGRIKS